MCGYKFKGNKKKKKKQKENKSARVWVNECDNCYESKKGNEWHFRPDSSFWTHFWAFETTLYLFSHIFIYSISKISKQYYSNFSTKHHLRTLVFGFFF